MIPPLQNSAFTYVYMHLLVVLLLMVQTGSVGNNFIKEKETVSSEKEVPIKLTEQAPVTPISTHLSLINKYNRRLTILRSTDHDLYP